MAALQVLLCLTLTWVSSSVSHMLPHPSWCLPTQSQPHNHRRNPLKPWTRETLSLLCCFCRTFGHSNEKTRLHTEEVCSAEQLSGRAQHTERSSSTQPWMPSPCPCFPGILSLPTVHSVKAQLKSLRMTGKQSIDLMLQSWLSDRDQVFWILNSCNWKLLYSSVQKHEAEKSLGRDF